MSEHRTSLEWKRESADFTYESYNRHHELIFNGGVRVPGSAAPDYRGDPAKVNPEEAFVAALSSCHMLTFLAIAAKKRLIVDQYRDQAVGYLEKNEKGKLAITRVTLRPRVTFGGANPPSASKIQELHDVAHRECFIANSVSTDVTVDWE